MKKVQINFFQFSRDGLCFFVLDGDQEPVDILDIWDKVELAVYSRLDSKTPILVVEPFVDGHVVSYMFTSQELKQYFSSTSYRIEPRFYSGGDYDTKFFYEINLQNPYRL